ncbi:MAG: Maebl [Firmicutes bacterium HGW-Firmicutes-21]|nr:MAG: Maebl [Firmicutes bacterium HGW-Firmicutes-21]
MNEDKRFAVLIDADNVSDKYVKNILDELSNYGIITYKRIYGDWTKPALGSWKTILLNNSIAPIQQYGYTTGKNATDAAMIIDAMDILYTGNVEGFCIVSSDSDFTRLASRLRESGMYVVGMGEKKTPAPFIAACNKFKYLEVLAKGGMFDAPEKKPAAGKSVVEITPLEAVITPLDTVTKAIASIVDETSDDDGWSPLSGIGTILTKRFPDFDVRNYGFVKLTPFIKHMNCFDIKSIQRKNQNISLIYIKRKDSKG